MPSSFPFHIKSHVVPGQHIRQWARGTANSQEDVLHLHVKQYVPKDNPSPQPGDVTIIGAHANGFPKELYEALWADLYACASNSGFRIRGIWIADVSNQGYSGEINEEKLGDDPCWHDLSRDLLHLTNIFRAEMPRPIFGLGHSFGANILTHLSLLHPRLFTGLVLLDPTIVGFNPARAAGPGKSAARASTFRRETWPSREAAIESFRRSSFYRSWDPRVLEAWNEHALRDLPTPLFPSLPPSETSPSPSNSNASGVTLRTTKHQEVFTFFRPLYPHITSYPSVFSPTYTVSRSGAPDYDPSEAESSFPSSTTTTTSPSPSEEQEPPQPFAFYRSEGALIQTQLPSVRPPVLFMHGATSDLSTPPLRHMRLSTCGTGPGGSGGAAEGRVSEVLVRGRGHLFPMEVPLETAAAAARWIAAEMRRWRAEQADYDRWASRSLREKSTMSTEFVDKVGRPAPRNPGRPPNPKL